MVCTTQQEINPHKGTDMQTHNKGVMIGTKMPKKTITISSINHHILHKKKILQTQIHKHTSNLQNSKSDKEHEQ